MWKVSARHPTGTWEEVNAVEVPSDGPFRSMHAVSAAISAEVPQHLIRYLEVEADPEHNLSRDAIETWAMRAQEDAEAFDWAGAPRLKAIEEAIALYTDHDSSPTGTERPSTLAWHDHTAVLIPIRGTRIEMRVEYTPDPKDEHRVERLHFRHASAEHTLETILDWRGYFGSNSAVIDGWTMMRRTGRGYSASFGGTSGFVIGTVLRRLAKPAATPERDPTQRRRLIEMEARYPDVASLCPDLSRIAQVRNEQAMVFVHGTVSCGIQGLKDLTAPPGPALPPAIYRFEHDTFVNITTNARELVSLIKDRLITKRLLLVAHSRGGLVAKLTQDLLRKDGFPGEVSIYTFGTPHLGTPLVAIGAKALNLLYRVAEDLAALAPIPLMAPATKAYFYTVNVPALPPGISAMEEGSEALNLLQTLLPPVDARAWAGRFDINGQPSGFGVFTEGALFGAMGDGPHDLVVPTESALAFGLPQPDLACSHTCYFSEPVVKQAIAAFFSPPVEVLPAPGPAGIAPLAADPRTPPEVTAS